MNKKLLFRLGLLFGFVLLISAAVIYFTFDIRTLEYLTMFEPRCILLALSCLAIGLIFDGLRLITLASVTDEKLTFHQIVNVVQLLFGAGNAGCQRRCYRSGYVYA